MHRHLSHFAFGIGTLALATGVGMPQAMADEQAPHSVTSGGSTITVEDVRNSGILGTEARRPAGEPRTDAHYMRGSDGVLVRSEVSLAVQRNRPDEVIDVDLVLRATTARLSLPSRSVSIVTRDGRVVTSLIDNANASARQIDALNDAKRVALREHAELAATTSKEAWRDLNRRVQLDLDEVGGRSQRVSLTSKELNEIVDRAPDLVAAVDVPSRPEVGDILLDSAGAMGMTAGSFSSFDGTDIGAWMNDGNGRPILTDPDIDVGRLGFQDYGTEPNEAHATQTLACLMQMSDGVTVHYGVPTQGCNLRGDVDNFPNPPVFLSSMSNNYGDGGTVYSNCNRLWDNFVFDTRIAHHAAASNNGGAGAVAGSAKAYNVIAVGAADTTVTPFTTAVFSSGADPDPGARKPEIMAPGVDVDLTNWANLNGTSFATPILAGLSAIFLEAYPLFRNEPQMLRAALLASADHNEAGGPNTFDAVAGAGMPNANVFINGLHQYAAFEVSNPTSGGTTSFSVYMDASETYDIALSWLVDGDYVRNNGEPNQEYWLLILNPSGTLVGGGVVTDQGFQLLKGFDPAVTGYYSVRALNTEMRDSSPQVLGFAVVEQ